MSKQKRLEWFACYPSKLLGALQAMSPDQSLVYVFALLRIYEVRGPATETVATLSRRTGLREHRVKAAVEWLVENGKLTWQDDKLMNEMAEQEIREGAVISRKRKMKAANAAQKRWGKTEQNQTNDDASGNGLAKPEHAHLQLQLHKQESSREKRKRTIGTRMPKDWKLTAERMAYGISRGLKAQEVTRSAEKFVEYWPQQSDQKGVKADWEATWRSWCIREGERLGREPANGGGPREFTIDEWRLALRVFETTSNWPGPGAPPGKPGCLVPAELLQGRLV